jgi:hypothetical protein
VAAIANPVAAPSQQAPLLLKLDKPRSLSMLEPFPLRSNRNGKALDSRFGAFRDANRPLENALQVNCRGAQANAILRGESSVALNRHAARAPARLIGGMRIFQAFHS